MPFTTDAAIEAHTLRLIDRSLPKAEWTHAGHFAAALWLLRFRPDLTAPTAFRGLITAYNDATGTPNADTSGYHHTISLASLRAGAWFLATGGEPLHVALATLMASPVGRSDWLLAYWRRETLFSVAARRDWVEPDLHPLPF